MTKTTEQTNGKRHYSNTPQSDEIARRMIDDWSADKHDPSDLHGFLSLSSDIAEMIAAGEWDSAAYRQSIGRGNLAGYIATIRQNYIPEGANDAVVLPDVKP